jgi:hypothetical protein
MVWCVALAGALVAPATGHAAADACDPLTSKQVRKNQAHTDDAVRVAPYAIMSNNAYARGEAAIPLPEGWQEVTELRQEMPAVGLAFAVFEKHEGSKLVEVVVAFRGTDDKKDWIQNLVPFHRVQVPPASEAFERILKRYEGQDVKVVATGHSLGGSLAFHMSFVYPNVDAVAFNSSPVTKAGLAVQEGNSRTSAWESGEILQPPRNPVNWLRVRWHGVQRLEFRFLHGQPVKQHSIERLALNLTKLGAVKSPQLQAVIAAQCRDDAAGHAETNTP